MADLRRAAGYLRRYWAAALGALLSMVLVTAANLAAPQLLQSVIDGGVSARNMQVTLGMSALLLVLAALRGVFSFYQGYLAERASQGAAYDMRNAIFTHIATLSFSYHDRAQTGQLMTRVTSDVDTVRNFTGNGLLQFVNALIMLLGSAALLLRMNWRLALIVLLMIPAVLVVFVYFFRTVGPRFRLVAEKLGNLNTVLQENLAGVRVVKAFAREPFEHRRYEAANGELLQESLIIVGRSASTFPLVFFIANLGTLAVTWVGGRDVIAGVMSIGELVAFNTYLAFLLLPIFILGGTIAQVTQAAASARRVFEVLDAPVDVADAPSAIELPPVRGRVAFERVSFSYVGGGRASLSDISFVAEPGQAVAILGATGAGKSTIINLIPRFYDATAGRVLVDAVDVREVKVASLRRQIGIVLQESTLFSGTIRENIAYGRPDATLEEVEAAARAAQAHSFIMGFPDGYATVVGERGVTLSGGQRQRVSIARALLLDPRILILDDSTSAVDAETEYQIQQALRTLMRGRTSFVIAQRLSTVRDADLILLLDNGRLLAQGSHAELIEGCGPYCELIDSLFGREARQLVTSDQPDGADALEGGAR
jgi:ATP-binding cassette, subfamily B, multidrug efflux pump